MQEQTVSIQTKAGICDTFIVHPDRNGPFPPILLFMDGAGIREELKDFARRLATAGYYVVLPNYYYRFGVSDLGEIVLDTESAWYQKILEYCRELSTSIMMEDTGHIIDFIKTQDMARKGKLGCVGYCLTGGYSVSTAAHFPDEIAVAASFCGTFMTTDLPDSPHCTVGQTQAELYVGLAEKDRFVPKEMMDKFDAAARASGIDCEIEIYPDAQHAFMFPQRYSYDKKSAEQHWARLFELFGRCLG